MLSTLANQCSHVNARGRRCRMLIPSDEESFCVRHLARPAAPPPSDDAIASALLDSTGALATAGDVNALLRNVTKLLACRQIDRKEAVAFGYLSQLLLSSLSGIDETLEAERELLALDHVNEDLRKMSAHYLAHRAAKATRESQAAQS